MARRKGPGTDRGRADAQIQRPMIIHTVLGGKVALRGIDPVALAPFFVGDVMLLMRGEDVIRLGLLIQHPGNELAFLRHIRQVRERPVGDIFRSRRR